MPPTSLELIKRFERGTWTSTNGSIIERLACAPGSAYRRCGGLRRQSDGSARKLTLISAPAGFGKTTLLSEWVHSRGAATAPLHVAWVSLDKGDNDLTWFWAYFIAAVQTIPSLS